MHLDEEFLLLQAQKNLILAIALFFSSSFIYLLLLQCILTQFYEVLLPNIRRIILYNIRSILCFFLLLFIISTRIDSFNRLFVRSLDFANIHALILLIYRYNGSKDTKDWKKHSSLPILLQKFKICNLTDWYWLLVRIYQRSNNIVKRMAGRWKQQCRRRKSQRRLEKEATFHATWSNCE